MPSLFPVGRALKNHHCWEFSSPFPAVWVRWHLWSPSVATHCIFFSVVFCPAKLYVECISSGVGSGEQSMYMHMSDMFSYYFRRCVFSAWNNKFCITQSPLLPLQLLAFSVHSFFRSESWKATLDHLVFSLASHRSWNFIWLFLPSLKCNYSKGIWSSIKNSR